jgi:hypothetical protein
LISQSRGLGDVYKRQHSYPQTQTQNHQREIHRFVQ